MGYLANAHLERDMQGSANSAIECCLTVQRLKHDVPAARSISNATIHSFINRKLIPGTYPATDPELFDVYLNHLWDSSDGRGETFKSLHSGMQKTLAELLLQHPKGHKPELAIEYFDSIDQDPRHQVWSLRRHSQVFSIFRLAQKLQRMLTKLGRTAEAQRIRSLIDSKLEPLLKSLNSRKARVFDDSSVKMTSLENVGTRQLPP